MATSDAKVKRRRVALHAAASAVVVLVVALGLSPAPIAHADAAMARLSVTSTWQTGFIARFVITNPTAVPLTDWRLEFDLPIGESVWHSWNSAFTQYGTHYVFGPANWNRIIPPGGSATGGFRGVLSGTYSPPVNCVLNGQSYCV
ncbi:cellulose binding domain-containing protein [Mycolicibacterium fluoranthenivorans]|uniref:Cellulose binding domain-containing protein n=1 Tax=Mycolicibacterium fluoranthenivorans TaxID=258505 RepID=A0A7G8P8C2_9MYCO|nr:MULTISPECIES: cellulose-binding domain-containing protein [Mycobacteriaceae]MCV7256232.1 cellulose binding domain-containing protein [Mycobacterium hackensackense]QNJ90588.1 cellulose binding domain-containing protein [Mycolicibacterium fluoranthenivorans]